MGNGPIRGSVHLSETRAESTANGVVQDLLERSPLTVDLIGQETRDVRVQREGRSHLGIMMPSLESVKMLYR